jgi:TPR repeat protein
MASLLEKGLYQEGEDKQSNIVKAIDLYNKAAQKDDLNALTDLAFLLENGRYVQKDVNEAHRLLRRASDLYYPRALNNLGSMYFKGLISDKGRPNDQKAFEYFKLAADQGYPKAFTNLGNKIFV